MFSTSVLRGVMAVVVGAGLLQAGAAPAAAGPPGDGRPAVPKGDPPVRGTNATVKPRGADKARAAAVVTPPKVTVPKGGVAEFDPRRSTTAQVGGMRVSVAPPRSRSVPVTGRVRVEVLDRSIAERAGVSGPMLKLNAAGGGARVTLHYGGFADA
jgi:hypothetical protein